MKNKLYILFVLFSLVFISCEDYVTDVDDLIDAVEDEKLDSPAQISFLIKGVEERFATTTDQLLIVADGLSDAFFFDTNNPSATFESYQQIDEGYIQLDNNSVDNPLYDLGELRFLADRLITRVEGMELSSDNEDYIEAMYIGNLYGGIARYYYATYFGRNEQEGGGTINNSAFIPSAAMYDSALVKFKKALDYSPSDADTRIINSLIARTYLYDEDYANAATYAASGMVSGDDEFDALYSSTENNEYYVYAGTLRKQFVIDYRYYDYVQENAQEANRIEYEATAGTDGTIYYYQTRYASASSSIPFMTWQENDLMLAELSLRGQGSGDAQSLINEVRASHSIDDLSLSGTTDEQLAVVYEERDKELYCTGARLPDQRRFDDWHLASDTWQYLPITVSERNANPNWED